MKLKPKYNTCPICGRLTSGRICDVCGVGIR